MAAEVDSVRLDATTGSVLSFDDPRGLGVVRSAIGDDYPFHCTAIVDGTRTIAEGASVSFRVAAGRLGRWEATDIRPVG